MKRSTLYIPVLFLYLSGSLYAQNPGSISYNCKPPFFHPAGMKKLVQAAGAYSRRSDSTLYIPVSINLVGTDQGSGYYPAPKVLDALCGLNADLSPYGFQFYVEGGFHYINSSAFYSMSDAFANSAAKDQFIIDHNTANTLNIYYVDKTSDAPGGGQTGMHWPLHDTIDIGFPWVTNYPQEHALILRKIDQDHQIHLLAHEIGHYFGLWHTFLGWEGIDYFQLPSTPEYLTVDWNVGSVKDSMYIFQIKVERVDGIDCANSGDFICDTPPDYLSLGFPCDSSMQSPVVQKDPTGVAFRSDGTYFMSYSNNECQSQFSPEQVGIMRYFAEVARSYLLYDQTPPDSFLTDGLNLIYPPNGGMESAANDSITLKWEMPGAGQYLLTYGFRVGTSTYLPSRIDVLVTGNQYRIKVSNPNAEQYWIVKGISNYYPCAIGIDTSYFHVNTVSAYEDQPLESLELFPNPTSGKILIKGGIGIKSVRIINQIGQTRYTIQPLMNEIDIADLAPGVYFVQLDSELGSITRKVLKM